MKLSRRDFIRLLGAGAAALGLGAKFELRKRNIPTQAAGPGNQAAPRPALEIPSDWEDSLVVSQFE